MIPGSFQSLTAFDPLTSALDSNQLLLLIPNNDGTQGTASARGRIDLSLFRGYLFANHALNAMTYIPVSERAAVRARTSTMDLTSYLQDALNDAAGRALYLPEGRYHIQAPLANYLWLTVASNRKNYAALFIHSGTFLYGDGPASELVLIDTPVSAGTTDGRGDYATTHLMINSGAPGLPKIITDTGIRVSGVKFNGNQIQQSGEGVSFCGVSGFIVDHCDFTQSYYESNYFVFSRDGDYSHNRCYQNGLYQIDGGGPMMDSSTNIDVHHNHIVDSGYYAALLIDSYNVSVHHNSISPSAYAASSGYQAIRLATSSFCTVQSNQILDSGYSAVWVHGGFGNLVDDNLVIHAGYAAGGGSNIHGITVDAPSGVKSGRHRIHGNRVFDCAGAGIALLEAFPYNTTSQENIGSTVSQNTCAFNQRDGIAVSGKLHRVSNNAVESNGCSITDGIPGNGYNGIALNGASWCVIETNTCVDIPMTVPLPLNIDASLNVDVNPQRLITHTTRTQNYGIVEYPGDTREESPSAVSRTGATVTVTKVAHTVPSGGLIHVYGGAPNDYNGYFLTTPIDADHFSYQMIGNPNTIAAITSNGTSMVITTNDPNYLGIGEVWVCYISDGNAAGDWIATVTGTYTATLDAMSLSQDVSGSTTCNFLQYGGGTTSTTPILYAAESVASDHNVITGNILVENVANPVLGGSGPGYKAYAKGDMLCGANSTLANNPGQS